MEKHLCSRSVNDPTPPPPPPPLHPSPSWRHQIGLQDFRRSFTMLWDALWFFWRNCSTRSYTTPKLIPVSLSLSLSPVSSLDYSRIARDIWKNPTIFSYICWDAWTGSQVWNRRRKLRLGILLWFLAITGALSRFLTVGWILNAMKMRLFEMVMKQ